MTDFDRWGLTPKRVRDEMDRLRAENVRLREENAAIKTSPIVAMADDTGLCFLGGSLG